MSSLTPLDRPLNLSEQAEGLDDTGPIIAPLPDDDGYASPDFDLPPGSDSENEVPPPKKQRNDNKKGMKTSQPTTLEEEEQLALQLLRG